MKRLNAEAPRQALLFVGVGQHILQPVAAHWLLPDIELRRFKQLSAALASGEARPIYLIYITRTDRYSGLLFRLDAERPPHWEFRVDNAPILKTLRLR